jgi:hypothetical protein
MTDPEKRPVYSALSRAEDSFAAAEAISRELVAPTTVLLSSPASAHHRATVSGHYRAWLASVRELLSAISLAIDVAERPTAVVSWWSGLFSDPVHRFFVEEAHLGESAEVICESNVITSDTQPLFYWTFARQPLRGDPIVPHCQVYEDRLYYEVLAPAREHLFEWTSRERLAFPEPFSWTG